MLKKLWFLLLVLGLCGNGRVVGQERDYLPPSNSFASLVRHRRPVHENLKNRNSANTLVTRSDGSNTRDSPRNGKNAHFIPLVDTHKNAKIVSTVSTERQKLDIRDSNTDLSRAKSFQRSKDRVRLNMDDQKSNPHMGLCQLRGKVSDVPIQELIIPKKVPRSLTLDIPHQLLPQPRPCHDPDNELVKGNLPDDVCDRCPVSPTDESMLEPCFCVGNTGTGAGLISITCPETMKSLDLLKEILTTPEYFTTHVSRFTMENSNVTGTISPSLWGNLDFHQVLLDNNKLDYVDNKAFSNSANTLHYLSLRNNNIKQYVTGQDNELPYLETLLLKNNEIPIIFSGAFTYRNLKVLDLSSNLITSVGEYSFADLDNIVELNLSHNLLTRLDAYDFKFNNHVPPAEFIQIILSNNNISYIDGKAFADLYFTQIELQNNQLTTLSEEVFKHILVSSGNLAYIMVSGNPIVCDCNIMWIVEDSAMKACFDDFICANNGMNIAVVTPEDLGNCTRHTT